MDQFLRLFDDRLRHGGVAVPETADGNACGEIQILVSVPIPQMTSATPREENIRFRIGLHNVLIVKFDVFFGQSTVHLPRSPCFYKIGYP